MERRLVVGLAIGLGASLLVIAFLAGRLSREPLAQSPAVPVAAAVAAPAPSPPPEALGEKHAEGPAQTPSPSPVERQQVPHTPNDSAAIAGYFAKIDAIQVTGSGDPMAFAQGILKGIERGDTSGLDTLVGVAKTALTQARGVQPPPSCADYHRRLLEILRESADGMVRMREAIAKGDMDSISALAVQFQAAQQKVDDLERMKKQLLSQ